MLPKMLLGEFKGEVSNLCSSHVFSGRVAAASMCEGGVGGRFTLCTLFCHVGRAMKCRREG
jgi:hypothetical protein